MKPVPFVLRDHREELWRRWVDSLEEGVADDYRELISSPLGENMARTIVDDLCTLSEAEPYEVPALLRSVEERIAADAVYRRSLGFETSDMLIALQGLRGAMADVLGDALVLDELPSFGDTLVQLKQVNAFLDRLLRASVTAS